MSIRLLEKISIAGVDYAVGATVTGTADWEAAQVNANRAVWVTRTRAPGEGLVPAEFATDASGNVTGLVGADKFTIPYSFKSGVLTKCPFGKLSVTDATTFNFTSHHQMVLAAPFYAVRVGIFNAHVAAVSGVKVALAVSDTWGADGDTTNRDPSTGIWVNTTFSGAATGTLTLGAADRPVITWTDWTEIASINRADGGSLPILMVRVMEPTAASHNYYTNINTGDWSGHRVEANIANGRAYRAINQATDGVTTPANFTQLTQSTTPISIVVQYVALSRGITLMGVGDSLTEGSGATVRNYGDIARVAFSSSSTTRPIEFCNIGWGGQNTSQYYLRALDAIPAIKPDFLIYSPFSPNDGATITDAIVNAQKTRLARVLQVCHDNDVQVIIANGMPSTPGGTSGITFGSSDAKRVLLNSELSNLGGYLLHDRARVVSGITDGNGQVNYMPSYTTDNLHPNEAGWVALQTALSNMLGLP